MSRRPFPAAALSLALAALAPAGVSRAEAPCHGEAADRPPAPLAASSKLPDAVLLDEEGREVRFADLVGGRRVAVSFIFTTCTTICPPIGANFARLQRELAERQVSGVGLLSVSVDPRTDTPERLKAWRERVGGTAGWTLLTGPKPRVDGLLRALGVFTANPLEHAPVILVGDGSTGRWRRVYSMTPPAELAALLVEGPGAGGEAAGR